MMEGFSFKLFSHLASTKIWQNLLLIDYRQFGYVTKLTPPKKNHRAALGRGGWAE
jgi:hypothetical protein